MAYRMTPVLVTLNDLESHSPAVGLFKCNPSNNCAVFYQISTDSVLAWSLSNSWASCSYRKGNKRNENERKEYLATLHVYHERAQAWITVLPANTPCLPFLRIIRQRSPPIQSTAADIQLQPTTHLSTSKG